MFFVSWALWVQMSFVLLGSLVTTIAIGLAKNLYSGHRNRKLIRIYGPAGSPKGDVERAAAMAVACEVPFGIRALQQGIEVEGVWISRGNTPVPGSPVLTPRRGNSPVPSLVGGRGVGGGSSTPTSPTHPITPLTERGPGRTSPPAAKSARPQALSFTLDGWQLPSHDAADGLPEFSSGEYNSATGMDSATLEVLEGRVGSFGKRSSDEPPPTTGRKSRSDFTMSSSQYGSGTSAREGSPSPPALTDGGSRADTPTPTPLSDPAAEVRAYLSESNHRLSHVAETGQLGPRPPRSLIKPAAGGVALDALVIPALEPSVYKSGIHFGGAPSSPQVRSFSGRSTPPAQSSPVSLHSLSSPLSLSRSATTTSDPSPVTPIVHSPRPVVTAPRTRFELDSDDDDFPEPTLPQIRFSPSPPNDDDDHIYDIYNPSSIISDYFYEDTNPAALFPDTPSVDSLHGSAAEYPTTADALYGSYPAYPSYHTSPAYTAYPNYPILTTQHQPPSHTWTPPKHPNYALHHAQSTSGGVQYYAPAGAIAAGAVAAPGGGTPLPAQPEPAAHAGGGHHWRQRSAEYRRANDGFEVRRLGAVAVVPRQTPASMLAVAPSDRPSPRGDASMPSSRPPSHSYAQRLSPPYSQPQSPSQPQPPSYAQRQREQHQYQPQQPREQPRSTSAELLRDYGGEPREARAAPRKLQKKARPNADHQRSQSTGAVSWLSGYGV